MLQLGFKFDVDAVLVKGMAHRNGRHRQPVVEFIGSTEERAVVTANLRDFPPWVPR